MAAACCLLLGRRVFDDSVIGGVNFTTPFDEHPMAHQRTSRPDNRNCFRRSLKTGPPRLGAKWTIDRFGSKMVSPVSEFVVGFLDALEETRSICRQLSRAEANKAVHCTKITFADPRRKRDLG